MPNKSVRVDPLDLGDVNETVVATYERSQMPYAGEHVSVECNYMVEEAVLRIERTGVVENINHQHITCLVRMNDPFPSYKVLDDMARRLFGLGPAEESKVEDRPTSTNRRQPQLGTSL